MSGYWIIEDSDGNELARFDTDTAAMEAFQTGEFSDDAIMAYVNAFGNVVDWRDRTMLDSSDLLMDRLYYSAVITGRKFGGDRMAAYLHLVSLDGLCDEQTGTTEWDYWVGRFGKRLLFEDDQGFVWQHRYATEDEAKRVFDEEGARYSSWEDDADEYAEDAYERDDDDYKRGIEREGFGR